MYYGKAIAEGIMLELLSLGQAFLTYKILELGSNPDITAFRNFIQMLKSFLIQRSHSNPSVTFSTGSIL
jgi:hypothetical protein